MKRLLVGLLLATVAAAAFCQVPIYNRSHAGGGGVNSGTIGQCAYYATTGTTLSGVDCPTLVGTPAASNLSYWTGATTQALLSGSGLVQMNGASAPTLNNAPTLLTGTVVTAGTSASNATIVGVLNVNTTSTASSQTAKQTLLSYVLPLNAMSANGKCVRVKAWGTAKATANNKTQTIDFGATSVASTGAVANNNGVWVVSAVVCRTGASAQAAVGEATSATTVALTNSTPAESTTGNITIAVTSTNVTDTDGTTAKGLIVEYLN